MAEPVTILYTNWRGEAAVRRILIDAIAYGNEALGLAYGRNEWHPEEQWLLSATDADRGERRTFAMAGIKAWGQAAVDAALASSPKWACNGDPEQPLPGAPGQPIATAPVNEEVFVYCGEMRFRAKLVPGASMTMDEEPCDQWQATREGEHPPCWSDGCCWANNEDENASLQPTHWSPAPALTPGA